MTILPLHDEAMALLAVADSVTGGEASADLAVDFAVKGAYPPDIIETLYQFAHDRGIVLPKIEDLPAA